MLEVEIPQLCSSAIYKHRHACVILCSVGEAIIFEHGRYISDLKHNY